MELSGYIIRDVEAGDAGYILDAWLKSYANSVWASGFRAGVFYPWHRALIRRALSESKTLVMCDEEDQDTIWGWMCAGPRKQTVHYAYVKSPFRRKGVAGKLAEAHGIDLSEPVTATHETYAIKFIKECARRVSYNPYAFFIKESEELRV